MTKRARWVHPTKSRGADLSLNHAVQLADVDVADLTSEVEATAASGYNHLMTSVPYFLQETDYWCGPAATKEVLGFFAANPAGQTQLAGELGTTTEGAWFPMVKNVLNDRKPENGPWIVSKLDKHGDLIARLDWGYTNGVPGVLHVSLKKTLFPYYNFDHGGHIMAAAGLRKVADQQLQGRLRRPLQRG
ncbi:MAG: C39 family peptidase [Actinobacteria bacterium]|nr:C39 family peptidase [Actinomycetota bacterium]